MQLPDWAVYLITTAAGIAFIVFVLWVFSALKPAL